MQNVMQALYLTRNARGLPASARRYNAQLIKKIVAYQKERGISSFVETVRQLCEKALKFSEITK
jgi:hypothetical protein